MVRGRRRALFLGTDDGGRDTLSRDVRDALLAVYWLRRDAVVGDRRRLPRFAAAFWPNRLGRVVMLFNDILMSIRSLLAIIIAAILGHR